MTQHQRPATEATKALLMVFGNELKALTEHREGKSRPIAAIDIDSFVSAFVHNHSDLVDQAQGPDLENLTLVTGRVHGDDDDTYYIIEGDNPESRFAHELLGFDPDTAESIPEDEESRFYITDCDPLKVAIDARLKPLPKEEAAA